MIASSQSLAGRIGQEAPPGITALRFFQPPRTPPPCFSISSFMLIDIDSSMTQGVFTCPDMAKSFTPVLFGRPNEAYQDAPRRRIVGTTAILSTLFTVVGQP